MNNKKSVHPPKTPLGVIPLREKKGASANQDEI